MSEEIKRGRGRPAVAIAPEIVSRICRLYNTNVTVADIKRNTGVGSVVIKRVLQENGITLRTQKMA